MNLVSLKEAKAHLYVMHDDDDALITAQIAAASSIVVNHLKTKRNLYEFEYDSNGDIVIDDDNNFTHTTDSDGDKIPREEVRAAVLLMVGILYKDRDGEEMNKWINGYLPAPITAILCPLRDPTLR